MKAMLMILAALLFAGCSRQDSHQSPSAETAAAIDPSLRTNRLSRAIYFQRIYSGYEVAGRKNPLWDQQAKEFFSALALGAALDVDDQELDQRIDRLRSELQKAGCEDPLVRYMTLRGTQDPHYPGENGTNDWVQVALDLDASGYDQYWKFYSYMRAAQALRADAVKNSPLDSTHNPPAVQEFRDQASLRLAELLKDFTLPTDVMFDAANSWINKDLARNSNTRQRAYDMAEPLIMAGWGDTAEAHLIRGSYYVHYAWVARGGGWASTVSDEAWTQMKERLSVARESLERSWSIKPILETALRMQWVELGASLGRKEMERWYGNAIKLSPGNYEARMNKLNWIHVKWHGSVEEMIDFGKECLADTNGTAALTLYEVHRELAKYHRQSETGTEAEYWKRPEVWQDVKRSFETFSPRIRIKSAGGITTHGQPINARLGTISANRSRCSGRSIIPSSAARKPSRKWRGWRKRGAACKIRPSYA